MKIQIKSKLNNIKKSTVLVLVALVMMPLTSMAQDIFAKYDGNPDVTYVNIKAKMFQILAKLDIESDDQEAQEYLEMVNSITGLKAIVTGDGSISEDITSWVNSRSRDLEELMEVKDEGTIVKFYVKDGKDEDHVEEFLIFVDGISNHMNDSDTNVNGKERNIETVIVSLTGNIDLSKLNFDFIGEQVQLNQSSSDLISKESVVFNGLKIYPNPSQDMVTIDLPSELKNDVNITVIDPQGKQIQTQVITPENNTINVSDWQAGVYLIQITQDDSRIVKRFVKQ